MFGILEKMDRFSNNLMCDHEKVSFIQEIIDNKMVWDMAQKYQDAALCPYGLTLLTVWPSLFLMLVSLTLTCSVRP